VDIVPGLSLPDRVSWFVAFPGLRVMGKWRQAAQTRAVLAKNHRAYGSRWRDYVKKA